MHIFRARWEKQQFWPGQKKKQEHLRMNVTPDQTIIWGVQILEHLFSAWFILVRENAGILVQ